MSSLTIGDLKPGDTARVVGFAESAPEYRQKLLAFGLTRHVILEVIKMAPLGDPMEVQLRNFRLSLRKSEASSVLVEII